MQVNTVIEQLLFTTIRITTTYPNGDTGSGTGFVYAKEMPGGDRRLAVVTNKHVIEGADEVTLHFVGGDAGGPALGVGVSVDVPSTAFTGHPDPDIDVAAMRIGKIVDALVQRGTPVFFRAVPSAIAATPQRLEDFEPIEPVIFVGYPNGLYDSHSKLPIVRRGHSASALNVDYEGKPTFLIDASVFPGSSGSPVFLYLPSAAPDKHGNFAVNTSPTLVFLGVVAAVYHRGAPVIQALHIPGIAAEEMIDLGVVYKASTVSELLDICVAPSLGLTV
ncbi:trypsin-like serine peptidase [Smaragdicoccus niigatensis]|uniref:trypsin-like serine peptidase n=1 Tax=Smaragdicoccus niigatensis TaxID=359359 RepID=UPI0003729747|nr:serine protease [Smaragdicoccus niigatensis]